MNRGIATQQKQIDVRKNGRPSGFTGKSGFTRSRAPRQLAILVGVAAIISLLAGCSSAAQSKPQGPAQVSVAEVACRQFGETDEFTGRLEAVNTVEVRPRVSGYLQSVHFKEGTIVRRSEERRV